MEGKVCLYIATHNKTGLKYFGKTCKWFTVEDLQKNYHGSGIYWNKHLKKHGKNITMEIYSICSLNEENEDYVKHIALKFSEENNIVKSKKWANLIPENGLDGIAHSEYTKKKIGLGNKNKIINEQQRKQISILASKKVCCIRCKKEVNYGNFKRYHYGEKCFDNVGFRKVSCLKCKREIGINNIKAHVDLCVFNKSINLRIEKSVCKNCGKFFHVYGLPNHYISCIKPKKEIIKIKKSSCCLKCSKEITNANIERHLKYCEINSPK